MKPDYEQDNLKLFRADCMEVMKKYPDKYFDLAPKQEESTESTDPELKPIKSKAEIELEINEECSKFWDNKDDDGDYQQELDNACNEVFAE